ncbi:hypothetical protein PCC8801_3782 [Rippkaea orientalis PCC 8801]|uniref:Uncharacterized protein n=2 Tax=Rippkaea TaxID=2546365 RepID=B7K426_RIPO1|nr:hypothetical protein PCC8801_3782 [Rippkaea orientalis PCC 8801]
MRSKIWFNTILLIGLLFIALGDSLLPQPLKNMSKNTRKTLNKAMINWVIVEEVEAVKTPVDQLIKTSPNQDKKIFHKPGTLFDRALEEAEKQTNVTN